VKEKTKKVNKLNKICQSKFVSNIWLTYRLCNKKSIGVFNVKNEKTTIIVSN
jgi:hypothetical protein